MADNANSSTDTRILQATARVEAVGDRTQALADGVLPFATPPAAATDDPGGQRATSQANPKPISSKPKSVKFVSDFDDDSGGAPAAPSDAAQTATDAEQEAIKAKAIPAPYQPTQQEIEEHNLTHLPYRSWRRHSVRGRGKSRAHIQLDAEKSHTVPHVSSDYVFLGQEDEKALAIVLIRDHATRFTYSHAVPC